jgi:Ca-activated chloride channel family protein
VHALSLQWPLALVALLLVPLVAGLAYLAARRRAKYAVAYTNLDVLAAVVGERRSWQRLVAPALFLAALAALALAVARPSAAVQVPQERATVVLIVDTSGSMRADDVKPTRLDAARAALLVFLDKLPKQYRVGLVQFSEEPMVLVEPTEDRAILRESVDFLFPGRGTALGDGLVMGVRLADAAVAAGDGADGTAGGAVARPPAAIVLLSDGAQTSGVAQPLEAADVAKRSAIRVYTVALGTPNGVVRFGFGPFQRVRPVPPDPVTLAAIAERTGGTAYTAASAGTLKNVYETIGSNVGRKTVRRELTGYLAGVAAALLLASLGLSLLWGPRLP